MSSALATLLLSTEGCILNMTTVTPMSISQLDLAPFITGFTAPLQEPVSKFGPWTPSDFVDLNQHHAILLDIIGPLQPSSVLMQVQRGVFESLGCRSRERQLEDTM